MFVAILLLILSYLLGSIPFGLIIGKTAGKDLRENGSGNIGSTNAIRILGLKLGLLSAFCDIIKGMLVIILVYILEANGIWYNPLVINGDSLYVLYGIAAVIGHCFPIYIKFKGGKAVATSLGVLFITVPISGVCALDAISLQRAPCGTKKNRAVCTDIPQGQSGRRSGPGGWCPPRP